MIYHQHCWNYKSIKCRDIWLHGKESDHQWYRSEFLWCHDADGSLTICLHIRHDWNDRCECVYSPLSNLFIEYEKLWSEAVFENRTVQEDNQSTKHLIRNLFSRRTRMRSVRHHSFSGMRIFWFSQHWHHRDQRSWWRQQADFSNIYRDCRRNMSRWVRVKESRECSSSLSILSTQRSYIQAVMK